MMYVAVVLICATNIAQSCQLKSKKTAFISLEQCQLETNTVVGNMNEMGMIGTGTCLEISLGEQT